MANRHMGSSIDDFLREEGVLEEFQARSIKEVIAWQLDQAMKERKLSKRRLAEMMNTSRTQVDRMLNPGDLAESGSGRKPVLKVAQTDPIRADVPLPASMFGQVRVGTKAVVTSAVGGGTDAVLRSTTRPLL